MLKKKVVKKAKPEKKVVKEKVEPKVEPKEDLKAIEQKRNALIKEIQPKLLSKSQLRSGGTMIRSMHSREKGYEGNLPEINALGAKLGLRPIGLGNLRNG